MLLQTQLSSDSINNHIVEEKTLSIIELISAGGIGGNIITVSYTHLTLPTKA